jgi:outer membrane receptor protein involved in Fe transport
VSTQAGLWILALSAAASPALGAETGSTVAQVSRSDRILEEVTVASTPLGGPELPLERIPANVQRATAADIGQAQRASLAQVLEERLGSVFINEAQSNPLQPDVQFRGFVASPLLGQSQGLAVYVDGVRINDPFGDVVNWALVPEGAIAGVDLIPGSNPLFGLNALGGALAVHTKSGFADPGTQAEIQGGSSGRAVLDVESGHGIGERFAYYASARYLEDDGWREHSPSNALHLFAKASWREADSSLDLSTTYVETDLIGNGPAPVQLLAGDRDTVYTHPDRTRTALSSVTLAAEHSVSSELELRGVSYFRRSDSHSVNGDESPFNACEADPQFLCDADGAPAIDATGERVASRDSVDGAALNRGSTRQDTYGASLQLGLLAPLMAHDNRLLIGSSIDRSSVHFGSSSELGAFNDQRGVEPGGVFVPSTFVDLNTTVENTSVYLADTLALGSELDLVLSARYNDTRVRLRDRLGAQLSGDHRFRHLNPAAALTYRTAAGVDFYGSLSESNRAPSPVELTCADPNDPCALPNAFLSDPPLQQVIARTFEVGARGTWRALRWHAGLFNTTNRNDILFVSAGAQTGRGFFANVGDTRRRGVELNFQGDLFAGAVSWFVNYTYLRAQFMESFLVPSPNNPAAAAEEIPVTEGDSFPSVPRHVLAAGMTADLGAHLSARIAIKHQSAQFLRGDEGNLAAPLAGYTTVNAGAQYKLGTRITVFVQIENVLDADYATFGLYGDAREVLGAGYDDSRFISPAAPRSAWLGARWAL